MKKTKPKHRKNASIKSAKTRAWNLLSKIRRYEDAEARGDNGIVKCVTCDALKHWKEFHGGHFNDGGSMNSTKFEPRMVHNQCYACNRLRGGRQAVYCMFMIDTYGTKETKRLMGLSKLKIRFKYQDYEDMIAVYKAILDAYKIKY